MLTPLQELNVDVVIAITHLRMPNDILLAKEVPGIDVILGGHDHSPYLPFLTVHARSVV